jgi:hypothetical protein
MRKQIVTLAALAVGAGGSMTAMAAADIGANTTVGALVYADVSDITEQQNGTDIAPTGVGFDIKRGYIIVNHTFNGIWSANLTTDAEYISSTAGTGYTNSTTSNSGGVTELYVKLLYLQAKFNDAFVFRAGSYNDAWIGYVQNLYGYRFVEKTSVERLGYANSADWGLYANGVAGGGNGFFNYTFGVIDGGGYKNPTRTREPDYEGQVGVKPLSWLNIGAGFYTGHLGQITETNVDYARNTATRWDALVGILRGPLRLGAEYFDAKNYKVGSAATGVLSGPGGVVVASTATGTVAHDVAEGYSSWVSYNFLPRWAAFGRFDRSHLSEDVNPKLIDTYYNLGIDFKPIAAIDVALVFKHENVRDGTISVGGGDANGSYTIGGTGVAGTGAKTSGQFNEVGIYTQYLF